MKREEINIRDPFVLTRNGQYYLYGTRGATCWGPADGFDVYVSRDLENWDGPFECFHNDGTFWADRNYWAPEVHEYHGKLYMLASFKREDLCRGTAILTADNPLGPFVPHSDGRVTPSNWECLDGTLYVSPDDKPYLVFAHEWVQVGDGEICAMPLSDDLSRAIGDWLLGMNATRAYTLKYGTGKNVLSIGRVQTPTLALVVERQKAIENFKPETYWEIRTNYREGLFSCLRGRFNKKEEAEALLEKITPLELEILSIERKKAMEHPPKLFDLTLLQVECNRKFAYTAENTLKIIQSLYEKKLTTYPRVDTNFLPNDQYAKVPKILQGLKPYEALTQPILSGGKIRKSAKVFNDKKITDHHAIIPTGVFSYDMSPEEKRVYDLVARRFIAVFYPDCEIANTTVMARIGDEDFKATGKQIIDPAWRVVFGNNTDKQNEENVLPVYEKGEHGPHTPEIQEKQTQPPKYYTEADLLRAMETAGKQVEDEELRDLMKENGIGRPSTRANIIETLFKRQYIRKDKKRILATTTGIELIDTIQNDLLKSAELTGQWEKKLRMIEDGTYQVADFMEELKAMVNEIVHFVRYSSAKTITVETPEEKDGEDKKTKKEREKGKGKKENGEKIAVVLKCPKCGQGEIVKGKTAWGCTLYRKSCDFLIPMEIQGKKLTQKQVDTLIQKGQTGKISGFKDPKGNPFNGMIRLDENKNIIVDKI